MEEFVRGRLTRDILHAAATPSRDSKGQGFRFPTSSRGASKCTFPPKVH